MRTTADEFKDEGQQQGEAKGLARRELIGQIKLLIEILGETPIADEELRTADYTSLDFQVKQLMQRLIDG